MTWVPDVIASALEGELPEYGAQVRALYADADEEARAKIVEFFEHGGLAKLDAAAQRFQQRRDSQ